MTIVAIPLIHGRRETRPQILWKTGAKKNQDESQKASVKEVPAMLQVFEEDKSADIDVNPEQVLTFPQTDS